MSTNDIKKATREAKGLSDAELGKNLSFFLAQRKRSAELGYGPAILKAQFDDQIAIYTAELERRENGGKILSDVRQPYLTDGERLALGLSEKKDNQ